MAPASPWIGSIITAAISAPIVTVDVELLLHGAGITVGHMIDRAAVQQAGRLAKGASLIAPTIPAWFSRETH